MLGLIVWLTLCILVGFYASKKKGRSYIGFFFLSFFLSPLIGFIIALVCDDRTRDLKTCRFCGEKVLKVAIVCKHCKSDLKLPENGIEKSIAKAQEEYGISEEETREYSKEYSEEEIRDLYLNPNI